MADGWDWRLSWIHFGGGVEGWVEEQRLVVLLADGWDWRSASWMQSGGEFEGWVKE